MKTKFFIAGQYEELDIIFDRMIKCTSGDCSGCRLESVDNCTDLIMSILITARDNNLIKIIKYD